MRHLQYAFESPLQITLHTEFTGIAFGPIDEAVAITRLRQELNRILFQTATDLAEPLATEVHATLTGYSGGDGDFYHLFYVPLWSFLHWVPATARQLVDPEFLSTARTAHAMSMFLHLWDDHLCDGQLAVDLLRMQVRSLAWERMTSTGRWLCQRLNVDPCVVDQHTGTYLLSLHAPTPVDDLDGYCRRFVEQVAIWTLIPRLLGTGTDGAEAAEALCRIVERFAVAWRLLDDVQDVHQDLLDDKKTAVWFGLDEEGQQRWEECRARSSERRTLDPDTWHAVSRSIRGSRCLANLLSSIDEALKRAAQTAMSHDWLGIASELEQCRQGMRSLAES